jgi:hypothetical protein
MFSPLPRTSFSSRSSSSSWFFQKYFLAAALLRGHLEVGPDELLLDPAEPRLLRA